MRGPFLFLAAALTVALAWLVLGPKDLGPADLARQVMRLRDWQAQSPGTVMAGYFLAYVLVTALSLPLALWLSLGAGAVFGMTTGLVVVSFASSIGATLAFLASRWLLRDWVHARLGPRGRAIESRFSTEGALYLLSLRLLPVVPFFAVNLAMGLTPIRTATFYLVSQIGMFPAGAAYVHAGTRLAGIHEVRDVLDMRLLVGLGLLAVLPWIGRALMSLIHRVRLGRRWPRPRRFDRDLVVIGAGAAGLVAANTAAGLGARVTLIEAEEMGGECLNSGCVPSKALIRIAAEARALRQAAAALGCPAPVVDPGGVMARIDATIAAIAPKDSAERYRGLGVEVLRGRGSLADPWTVAVRSGADEGAVRTGRAVVIATGSRSILPPVPGLETTGFLTAETLWPALRGMARLPGRIAIIGAGAMGCELAQAFARLGAAVTLIERASRILPEQEPQASGVIAGALERDGVTLICGAHARAAGNEGGGAWLDLDTEAGAMHRLCCDMLVLAVGREARLDGLGLEELGLRPREVRGEGDGVAGRVSGDLGPAAPHVRLAGDAAGLPHLTHVAGYRGATAALHGLIGALFPLKAEPAAVPQVVFTDPELARIGLSAAEAGRASIAIDTVTRCAGDLDRAVIEGTTDGFVLIHVARGSGRILGATVVGPRAGELIAEIGLAMRNGLGLGAILRTVHAYPTHAEILVLAASDWRRGRVRPWQKAALQRWLGWRRG